MEAPGVLFAKRFFSMRTSYYKQWTAGLVCIGTLLFLTSCPRKGNSSLTVIFPHTPDAYPTISFPDLDDANVPTVHWESHADTAVTATFSITEQQFAILALPNENFETLILIAPRHPAAISFRTTPPSVHHARQSADFHQYKELMAHLSRRYSPYDSLQNAAITDSLRSATLQYIYRDPLSKGVLIALQAVGPDSTKLLPIERNLSLYAFLDSLLQKTYHQSLLLNSFSKAVREYKRYYSLHAKTDSILDAKSSDHYPLTGPTTQGKANRLEDNTASTTHPDAK